MSPVLFALSLLSPPAHAERVLRNDTAFDDSFDTRDLVIWLDYPECAVTVLTPAPADLPWSLDALRIYLGSSQGNQDGQDTLVEVGVQILDPGAAPTGPGGWAWGEEAFNATVSSTTLTELSLDIPEEGYTPPVLTGEGSFAVWVCPPDPTTGEAWPFDNALDTSGLVVHTDSPSDGNHAFVDGRVQRLDDLGASGS